MKVSSPVIFILSRFACICSRQEADNAKISGKESYSCGLKLKSHLGFWGGDEEEEEGHKLYS